MISPLEWDSHKLGISVGKLTSENLGPACYTKEKLDLYDLVLARIAEQNSSQVEQFENAGFRFIGLDITLQSKTLLPSKPTKASDKLIISSLERSKPNFTINGFQINDSRLMLDERCKRRLPVNFWDDVILEHCEEFADVVVYATDEQSNLAGFISCIKKSHCLEMFLVAVHPDYQSSGLGSALVNKVKEITQKLKLPLTTSVMSSNIKAFNFYLKHHFFITGSEVVMHRWQHGKL